MATRPKLWDDGLLFDCPDCGGIYTLQPDGFMRHPELGMDVPKATCITCGAVYTLGIQLNKVED